MEVEWPTVILVSNAVIGSFLVITVLAIGRFVRRQFKARVNCWFCNRNTWVPYLERNKWICPASGCEQYNGFNADDGDYNVELSAQYSPKYNKRAYGCQSSVGTTSPSAAALCESCNRNQELKVHQLASFEATDENNYETEIEAYKEHLEDVYRLCPGCERIVKRRLNQAKTLILGMKRVKAKRSPTKQTISWGKRLKRIVVQVLLLSVALLLGQYFVSTLPIPSISRFFTNLGIDGNMQTFTSFWQDTGLLTLGYRLSLGATILVLLAKGEPMNLVEYISISSLCCLHFLIGERMLQQFTFYPLIGGYITKLEWALRVIALLSSIVTFLESLRPVVASVKLNDSFHRIEVDDDDECVDSASVYAASNGGRLDTSTDYGSVFDYHTVAPSMTSTTEDEEIRNISLNSARKSFHNQSDPLVSQQQYRPSDSWSSNRPSVSTMHLHSPPKLYPDDRFSNSIKSMRIGTEYHQIRSPVTTSANPFLKNIPLLSGSSSTLSGSVNTLRASSRSLLTPSRLSLVSGQSAFRASESKRNVWSSSASGFWTNHYPNVFTARPPLLISPFTPVAAHAHSMDHGLNERFVPLTESRSSSQSSGFESRQSTSSAFSPLAPFSPVTLPQESTFNGRLSTLSAPWTLSDSSSSRVPSAPKWSTKSDTMGMSAFFGDDIFPR